MQITSIDLLQVIPCFGKKKKLKEQEEWTLSFMFLLQFK